MSEKKSEKPSVIKNKFPVNPNLAGSEGVLNLKIAMATLEFHLEKNRGDLDIVREFENRTRKFLSRCETVRQELQPPKNF